MKPCGNMKKRKSIRRSISMLLAFCMTLSLCSSYAAAAADHQVHTHGEACYENEYVCIQGEHGKDCYGDHNDDCWQERLSCGLDGVEGHVHDSSCYEEVSLFDCRMEEHGPQCYKKVLVCAEEAGVSRAARTTVSGSDAAESGSSNEGNDIPGEGSDSPNKESDSLNKGSDFSNGENDLPEDESGALSMEELARYPEDAAGAAMSLVPTTGQEKPTTGQEKQYEFEAYYVNQSGKYDVTMCENFNLKYQMEFHASKDFEIGDVVIKIDAELFKDRNQKPVTPTEIGIPEGTPKDPHSNRSTPFNYYYEDDGQTLVFFNYKKITSGTNAAWQVLYKDQKLMDIIDGSEWKLTPKISVNGADGKFTETEQLTGRVDSGVYLDSVEKSYYSESGLNYTPGLYTLSQVKRYIDGSVDEKFLNSEGRLDTANWHFVVWDVKVKGTATQPWNMVIEENPGDGGKVVGYKDNSDKATAYKLPIGQVDTEGRTLENQKEESWGNRFYVVTAYPADRESEDKKVSNDITIKLEPVDKIDPIIAMSAKTATWTYKDYDWHYSGDIIGVEKKTDDTVYTGWLDAYRLSKVKGEDYGDMPFTTKGHMHGYSYTHRVVSGSDEDGPAYTVGDYIPNTYYTLTTVDDFVYLCAKNEEQKIMDQEDYYFSGVTINQADYGYDVWEDEKVASELKGINPDLLPNVFKNDGDGEESTVRSAVRIYAMLAKPNGASQADEDGWTLIDTVYLDDEGRMESYVFSEEIIAQEPWRVKVEHDTIDYETICTIDVKVRIKSDSRKMEAILDERKNAETNEASPEVQYENISGVLGQVYINGEVTYLTETNGSVGSTNYSEPGLVEATKELYKYGKEEGILLIRDNAYRTVTWLNETAASFKNAKSTNDVDNNRVLVDYYLTAYDGYEIYNRDSLNYMREEEQYLISPGRSHVVFYDLLPYGMQFDASYPITAGRVTDLSKDTYQTQPKSWDGTQVSVTVDPQKDIITNYRGTGRTMVAFHIAFSGADATSYTNGKWIEGWGVSFRAYYEWKDIDQINEVEINANLCAFMPDFSDLSGSNLSHPALVGLKSQVDYDNGTHGDKGEILAEIDRAYADMVKEYAGENGQSVKGNIDGINLTDKDGNSFDTTYRNVLYAKNVLKDDLATASESKIEKLVRADADRFGTFDRSAVVPVGDGKDGAYTYDITVTTATGIKDIVIFDRLEQAAVDRKNTDNDPFAKEFTEDLITWSGTFRSLDTTGLDKQGIAYTVYYNEKADALISTGAEDPRTILTEANGWYTGTRFIEIAAEKYGNDSKYAGNWQKYVKAVAVQLDGENGESYELEAGNSVSFRINMTAPKVSELAEGSSLSTYNNPSFSSVATNTNERGTVTGNSVKVSISNEETLEVVKKTSGTVPAAHEDENFEFRLYEEYEYNGENVKQYLAYTEYQLYKLSEGNWELQEGLHATDGNGYLYLHADEKAVFKVADAGRIQVMETESVFWESEVTEEETKGEAGETVRTLTVTNTYRPVLYMQKKLSAVPEGVDVSNESFTFKVEIKRNNNYIPLANAEFWYVDSVRLDGGIPGKISSGTTGADGTFTIKEGDIVALFPGVVGTEYRVSEVKGSEVNDGQGDGEIEVPWNWVCEIDNVTGTMTAAGVSRSITNYYKWKDLLLTKDITHQSQEDYDAAPQPFTFRISEVGKSESGEEILIPMAGKEWELLGDGVNGNAAAADGTGSESGERAYETSGTLNADGEFTCVMGFRTVIIKGLEAGKTYRIEELTEGIGTENGKPLYIPADEGKVDTTMPVYSTRRDVTITNDYQKRPLTVKKTVVGSNDGENSGESSKTEYFRFTVTVNGVSLPNGTPYTVTRTGSGDTVTRYVGAMPKGENVSFAQAGVSELEDNQFVLADGETAVFKDAGMLGDEIVVTEVDNATQIYPANKEAHEDILSEDGAEASFVNGKSGNLMISKEYMGIDETGRKAVDFLREYGIWTEKMEGDGDNGAVEFILTITDDEGSYVWPEVPVTVEYIEKDGTIGSRNYEPGDSITVEPWVTIIIPTGEGTSIPSNATYTLIETEESRNKVIHFIEDRRESYWLQISQSSVSDALGKPETVIARPSATICNEVSNIGQQDEGSIRGKVMTSASEEVPEGKKLVWRVERYDNESGTWSPAEGVSYMIFRSDGEENEPVSKEVEITEADGRITLYKPESGFDPLVWFPKDSVYLNLYAQADIDDLLLWQEEGKALLRLVEVLEESDDEWGMLVGYQGYRQSNQRPINTDQELFTFAVRASVTMNGFEGQQRAAIDGSNLGGMSLDYSFDVSPIRALNFVNSNSKTSLEIEKYMAGSSDTLFTMILEQVVSTGDSEPITKDNYQDKIIATKPGAGIPYIVHNADGSIAGSSVTGSGGEIQLEAGQYASLEVSDGTMWLVSEKTAATPNYRLKDLQPESGDVRLTKLNDNLMLITLPEKKLTIQYRVEWYLVDGTLLDSETRVGYVGQRVGVTESDIAFRKKEGYEWLMRDERGITATTLAVNSDNTLKLYFDQIPQEVSYTVEWYDTEGNRLYADQRSGIEGEMAAVTDADKHFLDDYVYDTEDTRNAEDTVLTSGGVNVLRLYFKKKVTVEYTVKYTDGVPNETVFSDQTCEGLHEGDSTPKFDGGEPTREGYVFKGWSPDVASVVSGKNANDDKEIVYTATWSKK